MIKFNPSLDLEQFLWICLILSSILCSYRLYSLPPKRQVFIWYSLKQWRSQVNIISCIFQKKKKNHRIYTEGPFHETYVLARGFIPLMIFCLPPNFPDWSESGEELLRGNASSAVGKLLTGSWTIRPFLRKLYIPSKSGHNVKRNTMFFYDG